jgi:hypothetical protein
MHFNGNILHYGTSCAVCGYSTRIIKGSALNETVRYGFSTVSSENYISTLIEAMRTIENLSLERRREMRVFILKEFTWELIAEKWKELFQSALPL